jgi:membrane protease YdiL (CAAX protease family)
MKAAATRMRSFHEPTSVLGKIVQFPLVRSLIGILFVVVPLLVLKQLFDFILQFSEEPWASFQRDAFAILRFGVAIWMYRLFTKHVEKRTAAEMSASGSVMETGWGVAIGGGLMAFMVALMWALSYYQAETMGTWVFSVEAFFFFSYAAFIEEIVFRVILFRHVEEIAGTWGAVIVIGVLFGALHHTNPNASLWSSTAIAIESVLLAGVFVYTRRIWMVWGIHLAWNYLQGGIFGINVSGADDFNSLLAPTITGPFCLTGGEFGVEASYLAPLLCFVIGIVFLVKARHIGNVLEPFWTRRLGKPEAPAEQASSDS